MNTLLRLMPPIRLFVLVTVGQSNVIVPKSVALWQATAQP